MWLHIRVDSDFHKEIADLAATETRTVSNMIRVLLQEVLQQRKGGKTK